MQRTLSTAFVLAAVAAATLPAAAQGPINRRLETIAIVPGADGKQDIHAIWTIEATGTSAGLNAGTGVAVFVGEGAEVPSATAATDIVFDVTTGACGASECDGECGSGFIDGVFTNMLCLEQTPCPGGGCGCGCRFPYITTILPGIAIEPGDEVIVVLFTLPGAFLEIDPSDDGLIVEATGKYFHWDRMIDLVSLSAAEEPGLYTVELQGHTRWNLPGGAVDLGLQAQLYVGAQLQQTIYLEGIAGPGGGGCGGVPTICDNGCGTWNSEPIDCELWTSYPTYLIECDCGTPWSETFAAFPAQPGQEVSVMLVPTLAALPALQGSEGDDEFVVIVPSGCLGDLDGDGHVGGSDLGALLGDFGEQGGPSDLNGDGEVDGGDLGALLSQWGPCFDV